MTPLAWYLLLVLLLSGATFFLARPGSAGRSIALKLSGHAWFLALLSGAFILHFLGWERSGAPPGPETAPYRLEHTGFYTVLGEALTFRSDRTARAARLSALHAGESLTLEPREEGAFSWLLEADADALPLRIDGTCVNLPDSHWLRPGDTLVLEDPGRNRFLTVQWKIDPEDGSQRWFYNQGALDQGRQVPDFAEPLLIEERTLQEGLRLSAMVQHRLPRALRRLESAAGSADLPWWNRLFSRGQARDERLAAGVSLADVKTRYRELFPLTRSILWVRQTLHSPESPMGALITPEGAGSPRYFRAGVEGARVQLAVTEANQPLRWELPGGSRVRYGFGDADAATLVLDPQRHDDRELGLFSYVHFESPRSWGLPENPAEGFMIFSREVLLQVDGFQLDSGFDREPFYAKARYLSGHGAFEVNDGRDFLGSRESPNGHAAQRPDEIFRLGGQRGVALRFVRQASPVPYPGPLAVAALLIGAGLFTAEIRCDPKASRQRLDLAWTLLWGFVAVLLVVRLVLAYRVAVLPPTDATVKMVQNVFQKSFWVAFLAIVLIPSLLVLVRWLTHAPRWVTRFGWRVSSIAGSLAGLLPGRLRSVSSSYPPILVVTGLALTLWIGMGAITRQDALFGMRVNLIAHLLILVGLAGSARWIVQQGPRARVVFALLWLLAPAFIVLAGDPGFSIHFLSLVLVALVLAVWNRTRLRRLTVAALVGAALLLVLAPAFLPRLLQVQWIDPLVMKLSDLAGEHIYYRLVVPGVDQEVLARPAEEDAYSMTYFLRNSKQHWQMLLYAAEGASLPRGYGRAPLSRIGMTYPTSMSDCVYAVYVLAEHGGVAGFLLLLLYVGLGAVLVYAAGHLPDLERHRSLALIGVGAAFALAAFYMASANLGLLVFTGQNLPLLSLVSGSDLLVGAVLLALTTVLLRYRLAGEQPVPFRSQPWVRRITQGYLLVLVLGALALAGRLVALAGDKALRGDFTLEEQVHDRFAANLPEPGKRKALRLDREEIRVDSPDLLSWPEKQFVRAFELQSDRYDPLAGFYYLEPTDTPAEPRLRINRSYLNLASPFKPPAPWGGVIEARGEELPALSLLGQGLTLWPRSSSQGGHTIRLHEDEPHLPEPEELSNWIVLAWRGTNLCQLSNKEGKLFVESYASSDDLRFQVHVDGEPLRPLEERALTGKEVLRITGEIVGDRHRRLAYSLMYLGRQRPVIAFSTWRNGKLRRVVSEGSLARLAEDLGKALDERGAERRPALPSSLTLTVDDALQQKLERSLADWMDRIYSDADPPHRRRGLSLTVLDAFSGEILALPSLPAWKIARTSGRPGLQQPPERLWVRNDNLRNHAIGSTIKPVLFAAVASGYWPTVDIGQLAVRHDNACGPGSPGAIHPHCSLAGIRLETTWDCLQGGEALGLIDARSFLVESRNFYAGVLGLLGTAVEPRDWSSIVVPGRTPTDGATLVAYGNIPHAASLAWAPPERSSFTLADRNSPNLRVTELKKSILFRQLPAVFGLESGLESGSGAPYREYLLRKMETFYPALSGTGAEESSGLEAAMPDLQSLRADSFHSIRRHLLSLFLGGGTAGRWNNIRLAEAAARLATGQAVEAHLGQGSDQSQDFEPLPEPLSRQDWRVAHLIEPLRSVATTGTARDLRGTVTSAEQDGYRILVKTGTLEELPPPAGRQHYENETLLFVIGKWNDGSFVQGLTLSGVLHLQDSKPADRREWVRAEVAQPILSDLLAYLKAREHERQPSPGSTTAPGR